MAGSNWKKLDLAMLRDEETDQPHKTAANNVLPGISAEQVIREIKGMIVGDQFEWCEATLRGILREIERTQSVTTAQWQAVERIYEAKRDGMYRSQKNRRY